MFTQNENESEEFFCSDCGEEVSSQESKCPNCGSEFDEDERILSQEIEQGRTLARIIIGSALSVLFITGIFDAINFDTGSLSLFFIRLGLAILLFRLFYLGIKGAKYIMIVLFGVGGIYGALMGALYLVETWFGILPALIGLLYVGFSVLLIKSNSVKLFQKFQRENRKQIDGGQIFWIL